MNNFNKISSDDFNFSPFKMIGKDWMLITAEKDGKVNSMTASWGGLGIMWGKNVAFILVRKSRYTKEFIDGSDSFSLSFLDHEKYNKELSYIGSVSGRVEDKLKNAQLTVNYHEEVPFIEEGSKIIICKKMFCQPMEPENFLMDDIDERWYQTKDYHDLYIGQIMEIMTR